MVANLVSLAFAKRKYDIGALVQPTGRGFGGESYATKTRT
jgi:hypothetical protein